MLTFHFGQVFVLLCLLLRGIRPAVIGAVIGALSLAINSGNPYFFLLMVFEILVVGWLYRRGLVMLLADIFYWLIIGLPLSFIIIKTGFDLPADYTFLLLVKQLLNGLLYTLVTLALLTFTPHKWALDPARYPTLPLSSRIFYLSMVTTILPALLVALIFTSRSVSDYQQRLTNELRDSAEQISITSNRYLDTHLSVVQHLAEMLPDAPQPRRLVESIQLKFPGFLTMLTADSEGIIQIGVPSDRFPDSSSPAEVELKVDDRPYFIVPSQTGTDFVSSVFVGRGVGQQPIIAISSPVIVDGEFSGIVEGSLNLPRLSVFEEQSNLSRSQRYLIVTDATQQVVYASAGLGFAELQTFQPDATSNRYSSTLLLTKVNQQEYLYYVSENEFGWQTFVLTSPSLMTHLFNENMMILLFTLLLLSVLFLLIVRRFSTQITAPLNHLIRRFSRGSAKLEPTPSLFLTREVVDVSKQLQRTRDLMNDFNQQLEEQVSEKTRALSVLNRQLQTLAQQDSLTGLSNRRYFDQQARKIYLVNARNRQNSTIVALDIDRFKSINDTYGHPVGDECIKILAHSLQNFFGRESDIVARYGGEEFVLLLGGENYEGHLEQLEKFRRSVEHTQIAVQTTAISMTISLGVVCVVEDFTSPFDEVMKLADKLLYEAKQEGRNRLVHSML